MFKYLENAMVLFMVLVIAAAVFFVAYIVQEKNNFNDILNKVETEMTIDTTSIYETRQEIENYIIKYPKKTENIKTLSNSFNEKLYDLHKDYDPDHDYRLLIDNLSCFFFGDNFSYTKEINSILIECRKCREVITVASAQ